MTLGFVKCSEVRTPRCRGQPQSGGLQAPKQFARRHHLCTEFDGLLPVLLGQVVMIALEAPLRYSESLGESVQFVETRVAHHVAPLPSTEPPDGLVDQNRHATRLAYMRLDDAGLRHVWRRWLPGEADAVVQRYREAHRRYHGVRHVATVVGDVIESLPSMAIPDAACVVAAAFFHDAVYDPRSDTNEAASAELAVRSLGDDEAWTPARLGEVRRLVLLTRTHDPAPDDIAGSLLCDADLAILGAEPAVYEAYRRGIRVEYSYVDDAAWLVGRARVLSSFIDRPAIFRTAPFRSRESRARANLTAELASLRVTHLH